MQETTTKTTETKVILNKNNHITIIKETFFQSMVNDIFTFTCIIFCFWFNYHFIGNNYFVNFLILLFIIFGVYFLRTKTDKDKYFYNVSKEQFEEIKQILKK